MKKINILHIVGNLCLGGAQRIVTDLAINLDKSKYNVIVYCFAGGGSLVKEFKKNGGKVIVLDKKKGVNLSIIFKIKKIIEKEKIDLVHTHLFGGGLYGRIAAILARTPIIIHTEHNTSLGGKKGIYVLIDKILSYFTDKIVAVSKAVELDCENRQFINSKKLLTIHNGVDLSKFNKMFKSSVFTIGFIGRLVPPKNLFCLFRALHELKQYPIKLKLIGSGPLQKNLISYAKLLDLSHKIEFVGWSNNVPKELNNLDVCVFPSSREGFSVAILESMVSYKPVITTDVGGNSEVIIDGETGFLIPQDDPTFLANVILKLFNNKTLRERIGLNAHRYVKNNFTLQKMICKYEQLYDSLIID